MLLREFGFQVTFSTVTNFLFEPKYTPLLQKHGIEVIYSPFATTLEDHLKEYGSRYDLVFVCRADIASSALPLIKLHCPEAPVIFHTIDLHFLRLERQAELFSNWAHKKAAAEYRELESWLVKQADVSIVHSEIEKGLLLELGAPQTKVVVSPLILEIPDRVRKYKKRKGIVFVGGFNHPPNVDAVKYLCDEVMPLLLKHSPEIILNVVGTNTPPDILSLQSKNVKVIGYVEDIDKFLGEFRLSVAPLRYGAGVKGKIGKSLAVGTPVVATELAIEGMQLATDDGYVIANNPSDFAEKILKLYNDELKWQKLSTRGRIAAEKLWGFESSVSGLKTILSRVGFDLPSPKKKPRIF
jgi:O-antigen biosynthesis protein